MRFTNYHEAFYYLLHHGFTITPKTDEVMTTLDLFKEGYEDSTMHNMTESEVIEYANKLQGYEPPKDVIPNEQFPNGFESWYETHFEMVKAVLNTLENHLEFGKGGDVIPRVLKEGGTPAVRLFAKQLTDQFEERYNDEFWYENDFEDTIKLFLRDRI